MRHGCQRHWWMRKTEKENNVAAGGGVGVLNEMNDVPNVPILFFIKDSSSKIHHPSRWTPRTPEKTPRYTIPGALKKRKHKRAPGDVDTVRL